MVAWLIGVIVVLALILFVVAVTDMGEQPCYALNRPYDDVYVALVQRLTELHNDMKVSPVVMDRPAHIPAHAWNTYWKALADATLNVVQGLNVSRYVQDGALNSLGYYGSELAASYIALAHSYNGTVCNRPALLRRFRIALSEFCRKGA